MTATQSFPGLTALYVVTEQGTRRFTLTRRMRRWLRILLFSKKGVSLLLLALAIIIVLFLYFSQPSVAPEAQAAFWWDEDYLYRKPIFVSNNASTNYTNKEVLIKGLDTSDLVSTGKMQSDCDDLRFVDDRGLVFDHWVSAGCNTTSTNVWIMMDQIPVGSSNVYAYYGNTNVSNAEKREKFSFVDGLVGYWKLDETGSALSVKDYSEQGNDGTALNWTSTNWQTGQINNASDHGGGGEYIYVADKDLWTLSDFTISLWVNFNSSGSLNWYQEAFVAQDEAQGVNDKWIFSYNTAAPNGTIFHIRDSVSMSTTFTGDSWDAVPGTWYYIGITRNGNDYTFYRNGATDGTVTDTNAIPNAATPLTIGWAELGGSFDGFLDDIKIYNRALTPEEITADYNRNTDTLQRVASQVTTTISSTEEKGPGPLAYYPFDEGYENVAYDYTSNDNDATRGGVSATAANMPTWFANGKFNWALNFDGTNDHLDVTDAYSLNSNNISISVWVRPTAQPSTNDAILAKSTAGGSEPYALYIDSSNKPMFRTTTGVTGTVDLTANEPIPFGEWTHLGATYDGTAMDLYVNGEMVTSTNVSGNLTVKNGRLMIGRDVSGTAYFQGQMDDLRLYPYARTAGQIRADMAGASSKGIALRASRAQDKAEGLVLYLDMEDTVSSSVNTISDRSGYGNDGTFINVANDASGDTLPAGKYGKSANFGGDDEYVSIANEARFDFERTDPITIETWVYPTDSTQRLVWSKGDGSAPYTGIFLWTYYSGGILFEEINATSPSNYLSIYGGSLTTNKWNHIAATYTGNSDVSGVELYINGSRVAKSILANTLSGSVLNNISPQISGRNGASSIFDGQIDDVKIYNKARTSDQIMRDYLAGPPPVAYWDFEEGTGSGTAYDKTGNGNDGTLGATSAAGSDDPDWVPGKYGGALDFDGVDDQIDAGDDSSLEIGTNDFTIEGWIKLRRAPTVAADHGGIIGKGTSADNQYRVEVSTSGFIQLVYFSTGTDKTIGSGYKITDNLNVWHHFAISVDRDGDAVWYVDGINTNTVSFNEQTSVISGAAKSQSLFIGGNVGGGTTYWNGSIDDVRIYNYARTQRQILEDMRGSPIYSSGAPMIEPAAHWKFDEANGTTIYDATERNPTGVASGPSWNIHGKFNAALNFDGIDDEVLFAESANFDLSENITGFSATAWIKARSDGEGDSGIIFEKGSTNMYVSGQSGTTAVVNANLDMTGTDAFVTSSDTFSLNVWTHVGMSWDKSQNRIKLYINGEPAALSTDTASTVDVSTDKDHGLYVGSHSGNLTFDGLIDEVKVFHYALTDEEMRIDAGLGGDASAGSGVGGKVLSVYNASPVARGEDPGGAPPIGWWKFDDGEGTTAKDSSGVGNDGTLGGGVAANVPAWKSAGSCHQGGCLQFDGSNDHTDVSNTIEGIQTVAFWVFPETTTEGIIAFNGQAFSVNVGSGTVAQRGFTAPIIYVDGVNATTLSAGTWQHVAVTTDTAITGNAIRIGTDTVDYLTGRIDDVRVYDYALSAAQVAYVYNRGRPVAWWKFDEGQGSTIHDWSGNGNHGSANIEGSGGGQTTIDKAWNMGVEGRWNYSLNFDGVDDYVSVVDDDSLDFGTGAFSVSTWFKTSDDEGGIFGKYKVSGGEIGWSLELTSGKLRSYFYEGSGPAEDNTGSKSVDDGEWHHVVLIRDTTNSNVYVYVDGIVDINASDGTSPNTLDSTTSLKIGDKIETTWNEYFNGQIDDVRIYNYARTPEQIYQDYLGGYATYIGQ